ncbi:hypothetical protein [Frigidibacter mobilis]|uniref:hypothetical protein n=1 Tax=Frigidibacter mobilis TaxID=1335048 RepID=UPI0014126057|nr:hypothetical protein [Frigidibacter mobilis]
MATIAFVIVGTSISSKPHHSTFDEVFSASFDSAFGVTQQFSESRLRKSIADLKCTTSADGCRDLIRQNMTVSYTNIVVANLASITFDGHDVANCVGAANMWICFDA